MKISIRTNHYTPSETKENSKVELKGFATLRFDDKYVLDNIRIMENKEKGTLFVALPTIKGRDGDYKEFFHPITSNTRDALNKAVLGQFSSESVVQGDFYTYDLGKTATFEPTAKGNNFFDYTKDNIVGIGSVKFGEWVCENIQIKKMKDKDDVYIDTPNRKDNSTGEYKQMFFPITKEASAEFKKVCVDALEEYKAEKAKSADWGIGVHEERSVEPAPVVENAQDVGAMSIDDMDLSDFEDIDLSASNDKSL